MFTRIIFFLITLYTTLSFSFAASAKMIVTTLPEFSWMVKQLAPNEKAQSLLQGNEDPHFVDALPSFIFKVAQADMIVINGMDLEIGWLPKVLEMTGNANVQQGTIGYCDASVNVDKIEVLQKFDRSMGDVHPQGNPHYTLSLIQMQKVARTIKTCLQKIGVDKTKLETNLSTLLKNFQQKYEEIQRVIKPKNYYVYHREFNYLKKDFDLKIQKSLEKVPGVLPSANYLVQMARQSQKDQPVKVLAGNTAPKKILVKFEELSGIKYQMLALHPLKDEDYLQFIHNLMLKINK